MADLKMTLEEINRLMEKLSQTNLGELTIEDGDFKLTISAKQTAAQPVQQIYSQQSLQPAVTNAVGAAVEVNIDTENSQPKGSIMKSPIVGTFYAAVSPDKPPFVTVGSKVKKGDVLFVIESMKLMNEVQSEFDGEIAEILVENAQGVEYHQPIMRIV